MSNSIISWLLPMILVGLHSNHFVSCQNCLGYRNYFHTFTHAFQRNKCSELQMKELINSCMVYFIMEISGKRRAKHTDEPNCKQTGFLVIRWSLYFFSNLISKVQQLIRIDRVSQYHVQSQTPNKSSIQFSGFLLQVFKKSLCSNDW